MPDTIKRAIDRARKRAKCPSGTRIVVFQCPCGHSEWRWHGDEAVTNYYVKANCRYCGGELSEKS